MTRLLSFLLLFVDVSSPGLCRLLQNIMGHGVNLIDRLRYFLRHGVSAIGNDHMAWLSIFDLRFPSVITL